MGSQHAPSIEPNNLWVWSAYGERASKSESFESSLAVRKTLSSLVLNLAI